MRSASLGPTCSFSPTAVQIGYSLATCLTFFLRSAAVAVPTIASTCSFALVVITHPPYARPTRLWLRRHSSLPWPIHLIPWILRAPQIAGHHSYGNPAFSKWGKLSPAHTIEPKCSMGHLHFFISPFVLGRENNFQKSLSGPKIFGEFYYTKSDRMKITCRFLILQGTTVTPIHSTAVPR